jgi:hypothetical protein
MFSAHGLAVVIGAEHHASLLGPLGGSFLSLDIWVDADDREEAAALLRDLRERDEHDSDPEHAHGDGSGEGDADTGGPETDAADPADPADDDTSTASVQQRIDRRRRAGAALLLGCIVTFGTAHMSTRAWGRGLLLAAVESFGIKHAANGHALGRVLIVAAILTDLFGALWRVRTAHRPAIPTARVHSG